MAGGRGRMENGEWKIEISDLGSGDFRLKNRGLKFPSVLQYAISTP
jgi:hypothetical protein